ncbi:MAG: type III-A CRISPR-associated RAMP protein Csm3, partial [Chloroflexi bacterium]|nr:type III-A CRISPR-associated RAMP protein Csm3 [Chloroflexota bacterium]
MKRTNIHSITFAARCESGLHIGGSQDELSIGGSDSPVIKHPSTREPYIPGSSLKGKMRSELERKLGQFGGHGRNEGALPCGCGRCPVCRVFGAHMNTSSRLGPSRIIVRDGSLSSDGFHLENKTENVINRRRGGAEHPRSTERVAAGAEFNMQIVLQVFEADGDFEYESHRGGDALQEVVAEC